MRRRARQSKSTTYLIKKPEILPQLPRFLKKRLDPLLFFLDNYAFFNNAFLRTLLFSLAPKLFTALTCLLICFAPWKIQQLRNRLSPLLSWLLSFSFYAFLRSTSVKSLTLGLKDRLILLSLVFPLFFSLFFSSYRGKGKVYPSPMF